MSELARLFGRHGKPQVLRSTTGANFIAASLLDWLAEQGVVATAFIEKGRRRKTRDELLAGRGVRLPHGSPGRGRRLDRNPFRSDEPEAAARIVLSRSFDLRLLRPWRHGFGVHESA